MPPAEDITRTRDLLRLTARSFSAVKVAEDAAWDVNSDAAVELLQACAAVQRAIDLLTPPD